MVKMKKIYCINYNKYRKFKNTEISYILDKKFLILLFVVSAAVKIKKYLKKNQLNIKISWSN